MLMQTDAWVESITWRITNSLTMDKLSQRGLEVPKWVVLCNRMEEPIDTLFGKCDLVTFWKLERFSGLNRRPGQSRITTPRKETDTYKIYSRVADGLHFNALAATTKDPRVFKDETLTSGSSEVQVMQNVSQASTFNANEDFSESPKKKSHRVEHAGESESCKHCNYKKSKCLKL